MDNSSVTNTDATEDLMARLAKGNREAHLVLSNLALVLNIDPDNERGIGAMRNLEAFGIYGSRIWTFFLDVCTGDILRTIAVLRACQLGILTRDQLDAAIGNAIEGRLPIIDPGAVLREVRARVPNFCQRSPQAAHL